MPKLRPIGTKRARMFDSILGEIKYGMAVSRIKSQKDLAKKTGIDPSTLSRHLNDLEKMTLRELLNICDQTGLVLTVTRRGEGANGV